MPILQNPQLCCGVSWCKDKGGKEHRAICKSYSLMCLFLCWYYKAKFIYFILYKFCYRKNKKSLKHRWGCASKHFKTKRIRWKENRVGALLAEQSLQQQKWSIEIFAAHPIQVCTRYDKCTHLIMSIFL